MELETKRQLIHASGSLFAFYIMKVGLIPSIATFAFLIIAGFLIALGYKNGIRVPIISKIVDAAERPDVIKTTPAKGTLSFFTGTLLVLIFFNSPLTIAAASVIILALGDSFSTLLGRRFGKHKISFNTPKSWEGTFAGLVFAFAGATFFVPVEIALIGALAGMLAEALPIKLDDNITVPVLAGLAMSIFY